MTDHDRRRTRMLAAMLGLGLLWLGSGWWLFGR